MINCHVHSIPVGYRWCFYIQADDKLSCSLNTHWFQKDRKEFFFLEGMLLDNLVPDNGKKKEGLRALLLDIL